MGQIITPYINLSSHSTFLINGTAASGADIVTAAANTDGIMLWAANICSMGIGGIQRSALTWDDGVTTNYIAQLIADVDCNAVWTLPHPLFIPADFALHHVLGADGEYAVTCDYEVL